MQFAHWQFAPQGMWPGIPSQTIQLASPNQFIIRNDPSQPDLYIQSSQPIPTHNGLLFCPSFDTFTLNTFILNSYFVLILIT